MNKLEGPLSSPEVLPDWVVECLSRLFSSISDHTRIRIVPALTEADRLNVSEIPQGAGSGFIWDSDGHIVTNFHVIRGADGLLVKMTDGSSD